MDGRTNKCIDGAMNERQVENVMLLSAGLPTTVNQITNHDDFFWLTLCPALLRLGFFL